MYYASYSLTLVNLSPIKKIMNNLYKQGRGSLNTQVDDIPPAIPMVIGCVASMDGNGRLHCLNFFPKEWNYFSPSPLTIAITLPIVDVIGQKCI